MRRFGHSITLRLAVVLLLSVLVGCGGRAEVPDSAFTKDTTAASQQTPPPTLRSTFDSDHDGFMTWQELQKAVPSTIEDYIWPLKYRVTAKVVLDGFSGGESMEGQRFQNGFVHLLVGGSNRCAWELAWLDARKTGDVAGEAGALHMMADVLPQTRYFIQSPDYRTFFLGLTRQAALGDPSGIQRDVQLNCQGFRYVNDSGTPEADTTGS